MGGTPDIQILVLGAITARNGTDLSLGGPAPQRILAMLAQAGGGVVTLDRLADATWPDGIDHGRAEKNLHTYVSRLRSRFGELGDQVIETRSGGYALGVPLNSVDSHRFEQYARAGFTAADLGQLAAALEDLDRSLKLWTDPPFGPFADEQWARSEVERLRELSRRVVETRSETLLRLGRVRDALDSIELTLRDDPYREGPRRIHMLALHRSGRTVDALRSFQEFRRQLIDDVGTTPSSDLLELDRRIASGDEPRTQQELEVSVRGYLIHELIGSGTFAEVFRGTQPVLNRPVAVKAIRRDLANLPEFIRAFESEASLVARLEHPHIVPLYDYWREPDKAFLVMRWLPGGTLDDVEQHSWSLSDSVRLVTQIGSALSTAHRSGVVHRDVKAANILLDTDGNFFLSDFGIAVDASDPEGLSHSEPLVSPGTPTDPGLDATSPLTDQYMLANTVQRMLFAGDGSLTIEPATPHEVLDAVRNVLKRATSPNQLERFDNVAGFCRAYHDATNLDSGEFELAEPKVSREPTGGLAGTDDPYVGLRAFEEHNHDVFHGRERLTAELLDRLESGDPALVVVGASGSGKSSVVRAGLLPALRRGDLVDSDRWFITAMTPGSHPFEALESALLRVAVNPPNELLGILKADDRGIIRASRRIGADSNETVLLLIDQFEEVFTLCEDESRRRLFLDGLHAALAEPSSPLRVVFTLRADFYDHPLRYPGFAEIVRDYGITVTPLAPDELERSIVTPAEQAGVEFERGLVGEILAAVASQPGGLPLLQHALSELFSRRDGDRLTRASYAEIGGIEGAIARSAESLYEQSNDEERRVIESLFSRLVTLGEGTEDTRRRVLRSELSDEPMMDSVIEAFVSARLITVDRDLSTRGHTLEVAHEAVIRAWPRLRQLLDENRVEFRAHRLLSSSSNEWKRGGELATDLYRGARLEAVEGWLDDGPELNASERDFIAASTAERIRLEELEQERLEHSERQNKRLRSLLSTVGVIAVLLLVAGAIALQQRSRANSEAAAATESAALSENRRLTADATQLVGSNRRVALLLAAEAHRRNPGIESVGALQQTLVGSDYLLGYIGGGTSYNAVAWVGRRTLVAASPKGLDLWDSNGELLATTGLRGVEELAASQDGELVAGATDSGIVILGVSDWRADAVRRVGAGEFQVVVFSPDDRFLVGGHRDGRIDVFDTDSLSLVASFAAHGESALEELALGDAVASVGQHSPEITGRGTLALAFSNDGHHLASGGWGYSRVWSTEDWSMVTQTPIVRTNGAQRLVDVVDAIGFDSAGDTTTSLSRFVTVIADSSTGEIITEVTADQRESAQSTAFGLESSAVVGARELISVISGRVIKLSDLEGNPTRELDSHIADTTGLALSPDETAVAVSSHDGLSILSLVEDGLIRRYVAPATGNEIGISSAGDTVIIGVVTREGDHKIFQIEDGRFAEVPIPGPTPDLLYPVFGPNNLSLTYLCAPRCSGRDRGAKHVVIDIDAQQVVSEFPAPDLPGNPAFSNDGELLAFGNLAGEVTIVELKTGRTIWQFDALTSPDSVTSRSMNFDDSGTLLAASTESGSSAIFNLATGEERVVSEGGGSTEQINFGPGPGEFTTGSRSGEFQIRNLSDLQPTGRTLVGPADASGGPMGPTFTEDGKYMVATNSARAQLIDLATGVGIGAPFPSSAEIPANPSASGKYIVTSDGTSVFRYDLSVGDWPAIACQAAGRNLTQVEWEKFGPIGEPYQVTCPEYPSLGVQTEEE